ncbi:MAG TPA: radical SAM protein [Pirellulales bacterium]|nr:radical SAM protein [Pirellulales bacterium]
MLDLVLINPASRGQVYQSLGATLTAIENPVWAGLMAEFARRHGLSVELIDAEALELSAQQVADQVAALDARLAVVVVYGHQPSASTQIMPAAGRVCQAIKDHSPEQAVMLVGGHVSALPEQTLREEAADYVAFGEGLWTMVELAQALRASRPDFSRVRGLWHRQGAKLVSAPPAPLVSELDAQMPGQAWDLLPMSRYRAHNWHCFGLQHSLLQGECGAERALLHLPSEEGRGEGMALSHRQPYAAIYTTLGCPYHCSFCCIQAPFKSGEQAAGYKAGVNSYRCWSTERVIEQIDLLVNRYGVRNLKIADEMFVLNRRHVSALCDAIIERGYDLNIWAYARIDTVHDGLIEKLAQAGFRWLAFGIEAADRGVRDAVDKRFDQEQIHQTIDKVRTAGIHVIGNYIFGLPEDNHDTMQATLDLALELNCEFANFYSTMAYPGSPLYAQALSAGWRLPRSWSGYSQHSVDSLPLATRHLSSDEVLAFRDAAFDTYFSHPDYLAMIRRTFGQPTVDEIRAMTAHKLTRRRVPEAVAL